MPDVISNYIVKFKMPFCEKIEKRDIREIQESSLSVPPKNLAVYQHNDSEVEFQLCILYWKILTYLYMKIRSNH